MNNCRLKNEQIEGQTDKEWTDRKTADGKTNGQKDVRMDRMMDGQTEWMVIRNNGKWPYLNKINFNYSEKYYSSHLVWLL